MGAGPGSWRWLCAFDPSKLRVPSEFCHIWNEPRNEMQFNPEPLRRSEPEPSAAIADPLPVTVIRAKRDKGAAPRRLAGREERLNPFRRAVGDRRSAFDDPQHMDVDCG